MLVPSSIVQDVSAFRGERVFVSQSSNLESAVQRRRCSSASVGR